LSFPIEGLSEIGTEVSAQSGSESYKQAASFSFICSMSFSVDKPLKLPSVRVQKLSEAYSKPHARIFINNCALDIQPVTGGEPDFEFYSLTHINLADRVDETTTYTEVTSTRFIFSCRSLPNYIDQQRYASDVSSLFIHKSLLPRTTDAH
jgi:hypothetical protein